MLANKIRLVINHSLNWKSLYWKNKNKDIFKIWQKYLKIKKNIYIVK